eukprot:332511_1
MGSDCGPVEIGFCLGGCCFFIGSLALIGGIILAVQYGNLKDAEMTECMFFDEIKEDCTVTSQTGKSYSTCSGSKPIYFYRVLSHYAYDETNIECSYKNDTIVNGTGIDYWQIYRDGICICAMDFVSEQPYPKYNDNQWHTCYIADCDDNQWSWDSPTKHEKDYIGAFITASVFLVVSYITCGVGIYYDQ